MRIVPYIGIPDGRRLVYQVVDAGLPPYPPCPLYLFTIIYLSPHMMT